MSLGKDLASIRKKLKLSIEQIQSQIKIHAHILVSIENDAIFNDQSSNKTYMRSFVRSYAKALGLTDELIVSALDAVETGTYESGNILELDISKIKTTTNQPNELEDSVESSNTSNRGSLDRGKPSINTVNWAEMGRKFSTPATNPKIFIPVLIALILVSSVAIIFHFRTSIMSIFSSSETEEVGYFSEPFSQDESIIASDLSTITSNLTEESIVEEIAIKLAEEDAKFKGTSLPHSSILSDTLSLIIYAAFDKLEPVRVTSDFNWRTNPFWMEQGQAYAFNFIDTVLVQGQSSRFLLLFNGHVIDYARSKYFDEAFDSIVLTRKILSADNFLAQPPEIFPYEVGAPDSLIAPL